MELIEQEEAIGLECYVVYRINNVERERLKTLGYDISIPSLKHLQETNPDLDIKLDGYVIETDGGTIINS